LEEIIMNIHKHPDDLSIDHPTLPPFHSGRLQECQDAMAGALTKVMDDAEASGWTIAEITVAMATLADVVMLSEVDLEATNFLFGELANRK
jgi:hypothetical protein